MPMQTVTKPIMLDETGLLIVDALSGLTDAVKPDAVNIPYDNTDSGLEAETVQGAIDENAGAISELNSSITTLNSSKANLASPTFTGTPKAPTASSGTNNTQIATTAFVKTACDSKVDASWTKLFDKSYTTDLATGTSKTITWSSNIFTYTEMVVVIKVNVYQTTLHLPRPLFDSANNILDIDYNNREYVYTLQFRLNTGTSAYITNTYKAGFSDSQTKVVQIYVR